MAILLHMEMTETSLEDYDALAERVGAFRDPPDGLVVHTATPIAGGGVRIMDVWESEGALERFEQERLLPVSREMWGEPSGPPVRRDIVEVHDLWRR